MRIVFFIYIDSLFVAGKLRLTDVLRLDLEGSGEKMPLMDLMKLVASAEVLVAVNLSIRMLFLMILFVSARATTKGTVTAEWKRAPAWTCNCELCARYLSGARAIIAAGVCRMC